MSHVLKALGPAWQLISRYPLLLGMLVILQLLNWGKLLSSYESFHQLWNETWWIGIFCGLGMSLLMGGIVLATYLLQEDQKKEDVGNKQQIEAIAFWPYWMWWGILVVFTASPMVVLSAPFELENLPTLTTTSSEDPAKPLPNWEEERQQAWSNMASSRFWYPLGLLIGSGLILGLRFGVSQWFESPFLWSEIAVVVLVGGYLLMVLLHWLDESFFLPIIPASVCVLLLFGMLTGLAWLATMYAGKIRWLYPVLILILLLPTIQGVLRGIGLNWRWETEYQLPHMEELVDKTSINYYQKRTPIEDYVKRQKWDAQKHGLLDDQQVLETWHQHMLDTFGEPQPVIVVGVSGGASGSALYVAHVLYTLEQRFPGFAERVRVICGASGGMLGASYFVTQLRPGGLIYNIRKDVYGDPDPKIYKEWLSQNNNPTERAKIEAKIREYVDKLRENHANYLRPLEQDFLSPILQKWVHKDMPISILGGTTTNDRGHALELAWNKFLKTQDGKQGLLDVPFADLREEEKQAKIPSLIFSPMMIEDGRQLLISNLDLNYMTDTTWTPKVGKVDTETKAESISHSSMEFFRLFPDAKQFRLGTAVRMNASFPFLSPAAELPTNPTRHVVDAGYYDNYGTTVATRWINQHVNWFTKEFQTSKEIVNKVPVVIYLRIRYFAFERYSTQFTTKEEETRLRIANGSQPVSTSSSWYSVTSPLFGLFSAWRANMVYRGDERISATERVLELLQREKRKEVRTQLSRPYIEFSEDSSSLNWILSSRTRFSIKLDLADVTKLLQTVATDLEQSKKTSEENKNIASGKIKNQTQNMLPKDPVTSEATINSKLQRGNLLQELSKFSPPIKASEVKPNPEPPDPKKDRK